jgi:hypothetical protein
MEDGTGIPVIILYVRCLLGSLEEETYLCQPSRGQAVLLGYGNAFSGATWQDTVGNLWNLRLAPPDSHQESKDFSPQT